MQDTLFDEVDGVGYTNRYHPLPTSYERRALARLKRTHIEQTEERERKKEGRGG